MRKKLSPTLIQMLTADLVLLALWILFWFLFHTFHQNWMESASITMMTVFYHISMRLAVGEGITALYRSREFNLQSIGFRTRRYEDKLYKLLKVKQWKHRVITAKPEQFDLKQVNPPELLHNVLQAELVHRIIMVLSFVPLLFIIPYGTPLVFWITSIAACLIDLQFVIIQRYNRPRVLRLVQKWEKSTHSYFRSPK